MSPQLTGQRGRTPDLCGDREDGGVTDLPDGSVLVECRVVCLRIVSCECGSLERTYRHVIWRGCGRVYMRNEMYTAVRHHRPLQSLSRTPLTQYMSWPYSYYSYSSLLLGGCFYGIHIFTPASAFTKKIMHAFRPTLRLTLLSWWYQLRNPSVYYVFVASSR